MHKRIAFFMEKKICTHCKKPRALNRFGKKSTICHYCKQKLQGTINNRKPINQEIQLSKCPKCGKQHKAFASREFCYECKRTDDYKNFRYYTR